MTHTDKTKNQLLQDITPMEYRCSIGGCPAVFNAADNKLVIIGKKPAINISDEIKHRVADDEYAIVVDRDMILSSFKL
jgi:hypothetical protein